MLLPIPIDIFAARDDKLIDHATASLSGVPKHAYAHHLANPMVRIHLTYSTLRHVVRMIHFRNNTTVIDRH